MFSRYRVTTIQVINLPAAVPADSVSGTPLRGHHEHNGMINATDTYLNIRQVTTLKRRRCGLIIKANGIF